MMFLLLAVFVGLLAGEYLEIEICVLDLQSADDPMWREIGI